MADRRPNILYIMSDDHAATAISAYGSRLAKDAPTPNIDRIANEGMRLDNCHCVNSICTPSRANILTGQHSHINGVRTLSDSMHSIDVNVGRLLDYLDESGLAENTIVIYTSDQGMMLGEHDHIDKRWIFDESQRMPFLIRYPQGIDGNTTCDEVVDNTDFAPTLLEYAGIKVPGDMQGQSFRALLEGEMPDDRKQSVYYRYWMHMAHHWVPAHYGVRTKTRKLIFFYGMKLDASGCNHPDCDENTSPGFELYDLEKDPQEKRNVYNDPAYADDVSVLKAELLRLKGLYGDTDEAYPELQALQKQVF